MPETGGKCWCKADVPLVKEEVIREHLSKQDSVLEEVDKNCRILRGMYWKDHKYQFHPVPTTLLWAELSAGTSGCLGPLTT